MRTYLLAAIIMALYLGVSGQRGGSMDSSSPSDHPGQDFSGHRPMLHSTKKTPKHCTTTNGTTTCYYEEESNEGSLLGFIICISIFGVFSIYGYLQQTKNAAKRKAIVEKSFTDFEGRMEEYPSLLNQSSKNRLIEELMAKSYTMVVNVKGKSGKLFCQLKITGLSKESNYRCRVKLEGKDEVGDSKFDGVLVFREQGLAWRLSKVYDDRGRAQQKGEFDILYYEGRGTPEKMEGHWAFNGFQSSEEYSGTWTMMQL